MDRCALFIDAGYVRAGGRAALGLVRDAPIRVRYERLIPRLDYEARLNCNLNILRTYFYDAAENAIATEEQRIVAGMRHVKLRLGRLVNGRQKGVDALLIRDLMTLARERAVATAYLVSGDDDIREGVAAAQDMGVQVVLIGFPSSANAGQAQTLIDESDEHLRFDNEWWRNDFEQG